MSATAVTPAIAPFDRQGDLPDAERVQNAMRSFVADFGATAATHMSSCVRCGLCAEACHFYVQTGDPKYTPIHKLKPFEQAYNREVGPFAPLYRWLGLSRKVTIEELQEWEEPYLRFLHALRPVHADLPDGHRHRRAGQGG